MGDRCEEPLSLVGDVVGVVARTVEGDAEEFCRRNGEGRGESKESGEGRSGV